MITVLVVDTPLNKILQHIPPDFIPDEQPFIQQRSPQPHIALNMAGIFFDVRIIEEAQAIPQNLGKVLQNEEA